MCAWIHYIHISTGPISVKNPDQIRSRDSYCRWRHSSPQTSSPVESSVKRLVRKDLPCLV